MPRESSKCREWEKERRNRLNEAFQQLCKLLPCYDPSVNTSKLDILRNACKLIEELQEKIKELTCDNNEEKLKKIRNDEIRKLQERLRKLLSKNEQLCCLLRDAKITIPAGCGIVKKFRSHLYWSNRFTPEQVKILQDKEQENSKENNEDKLKKITNKNKTNNGTPKHRKVIVNRAETKKLKTSKRKKLDIKTKPNCLIVLSKQPTVTQSCYVITNAPSNGILADTTTVLTNSNLLTTPLVTTNIKNSNNKTVTTVQAPSLGPGTLILANGTIVPVLPPPPPPAPPPSQQHTILSTQILTTQSNPTVILLPKITTSSPKSIEAITTTTTKTTKLTRIKPKYCLTRTTQANKVPIPALTSRYSHSDVVLKKTDNKIIKNDKKKLEKSNEIGVKRKLSETDKENCKKTKVDSDNEINKRDSNVEQESNQQVVKDAVVEENIDKNQDNLVKDTENQKDLKKSSEINKEILPISSVVTTTTIENTVLTTSETTNCNKDNNEFSGNSGTVDVLEKNVDEATTSTALSTTTTTTTTAIDTVAVTTMATTTITTGTTTVTTTTTTITTTGTTTSTMSMKTTQQPEVKNLELNLNHSELSNDIFATLQVPSGCQNPESTSPTAAFLLAFPLVSSLTGVKVTEVTEEDNNTVESQRGTPTLLQIGTMDTTKTTQSDNLTPNLLNLDNLSFFSTNHFYNYENTATITTTTTTTTTTNTTTSTTTVTTLNKNANLLDSSGNNGTVLTDCQLKTTTSTTVATSIIPSTTIKKNYSNYKSSYNYNNFDDLTIPTTTTTTTKIPTYSTIIKNYPDPLYTNSNTYNYNYNDNNFNQNYYKNITRTDNRNYYSLNYENYTDYRKNDLNFNGSYYGTTTTTTALSTAATTTTTLSTTQFTKDKFLNNKGKNDRPPVNWMTTPDYGLPQFTKENDFYVANPLVTTIPTTAVTTTYFSTINQNSNNLINNNNINDNNQENKKNLDLSLNYHHHYHSHHHHQKNDIDDNNQFSWSPTKLPQFFEPTTHSFVTSTLPTLVGDLSLNNSTTTTATTLNFLNETKTDLNHHKYNTKKDNNNNNRRQISNNNNKTYENQSNFLSVSQLVDHNKNESIPARATNRRNSGNRSSKKVHHHQQQQQQQQKNRSGGGNRSQDKEQNNKSQLKQLNYNIQEANNELYCDSTKNHRNLSKNYSAEALISSHQLPQNRQNYPTTTTTNTTTIITTTTTTNKLSVPPPFLPENPILPYFPSVDLQSTQDNNYGIQQNQNYPHHHHHHPHHHHPQTFSHNFSSSFQNNNYTSNNFIPPPPPPPPQTTTTTSYLTTNSFIHDMGTHDYTDNLNLFPTTTTATTTTTSMIQNKDKSYNKNRILGNNQQNICSINNNINNNNNNGNINNSGNKKRKKQNDINTTNLPGFVDFSFFSMSGTINSPILPDDFHTGFLTTPTPQLYPCKNPLYSTKQNDLTTSTLLPPPLPPVPSNNNNNNNNGSGGNNNNNGNNRSNVQHPEISPSINNVGTSLTNFNLSTIFPEINNKGVLSEPYLEPRIKEHTVRNYNSTAQVSFNDKPSFSFNYINSTSQSYNQ